MAGETGEGHKDHYYQVLGVPRGSSGEVIKKAYWKKVRGYSDIINIPPNVPKTDDYYRRNAQLQEINEAYRVLSEVPLQVRREREDPVPATESPVHTAEQPRSRGEEQRERFNESEVRERIAQMDDLDSVSRYVVELLNVHPTNQVLLKWFERLKLLQLKASTPENFIHLSAAEKSNCYLAYQHLAVERSSGVQTFGKVLERLKPVFVPFEAKIVIDRYLNEERQRVYALSTDNLIMAVQELKAKLVRDPEWQQWEQYASNIVSDINTIASVLEIQRGKPTSYKERAALCNSLMHLQSNVFGRYCEDITMRLSTHFVDFSKRIAGDFPTLSEYLSFLSNEKLTNIPMARDAWKPKDEELYREQVVFGRDVVAQLARFTTQQVDWSSFIQMYKSQRGGILWDTFFARGVYSEHATHQERHVQFDEMAPIIRGILRAYLEKELQQYARQFMRIERERQLQSLEEFLFMLDLAENKEASLAIHNMVHLWDSMSRKGVLRRLMTTKELTEELSTKKALQSLPLSELIHLLDEKHGITKRA